MVKKLFVLGLLLGLIYTTSEIDKLTVLYEKYQGLYESIAGKRDVCAMAERRLQEIHTDWSHNGFKTLAKDIHYYCPRCTQIGENLARGQATVEKVYKDWQASPEHKANLDKQWQNKCLVHDEYEGHNYYVEVYIN